MAQTRKQRRRTKHRGNAAGMVESRGRTGRKAEASGKTPDKDNGLLSRRDRADAPPSLKSSFNRAAISALVLFALLLFVLKQDVAQAFGLSAVALAIYVPIGYLADSFLYKRRLAQLARDKH
jgi:hypothetical protein